MQEKEKPLAEAFQANQQRAEIRVNNLSSQDNSLSLSGQGRVPFDNSVESQRAIILETLKAGNSLTTLFARNVLGICHPGMRICELRKMGHDIQTHWVDEIDTTGKLHRVARYLLQPSKQMRLF